MTKDSSAAARPGAVWLGRVAAVGWLVLMTLVSVPVARATLALAVSLPELTERADHVVIATAVAKQCSEDSLGRIVTDVELVVEQTEKGPLSPGDTVLLRRLGGEMDGVGMLVVGAPTFQLGERQLLFAADDPGDGGWVHALELSQGRMRIFERGGRPWVHAGGEGLSLTERTADGRLKSAPRAADRPLSDVLDEVRDVLSGGAQ